jgi:hypothetical protein
MFRGPVGRRLRAMTTPTTTETSRCLEPTGHDTFVDGLAELRELDSRTADGIAVSLLWRRGDTHTLLRVDDTRLGVRFELRVPGADALDAFHHPFAYAG